MKNEKKTFEAIMIAASNGTILFGKRIALTSVDKASTQAGNSLKFPSKIDLKDK